MSANDHDSDLYDAIEDLLNEGALQATDDACGVARQVISSGYDCLTPKQRVFYDAVVTPALVAREEELRIIRITNSAMP